MFKKYQLINIARGQLNIDEDSYRAMIMRINKGKGSSLKDCTSQQLNQILIELKSKGFKTRPNIKKNHSKKHRSPIHNKILSLWIELERAGILRDGSDKALNNYCKKYRWSDRDWDHWHFMEEAEALQMIERLKKWKDREEVN